MRKLFWLCWKPKSFLGKTLFSFCKHLALLITVAEKQLFNAASRPLEEAEPMPRAKRPLPDVTCCHCGGVIHEDDRADALFSRCKTRPAKEVWIHKTCWKKELQAWKH